MFAVLHFDPVGRAAAAVRAISRLRDKALEAKLAGFAEEVGTDLALLERRDKHAVRTTSERPCKIGFAHAERQGSEILAVERENIEGVELLSHRAGESAEH